MTTQRLGAILASGALAQLCDLRARLEQALVTYCERDKLALVRLVEFFEQR